MGLFNSLGGLAEKVAVGTYDAYKQASDTTKTAQSYLWGYCLYITQNEALFLKGEFKDSLRYFEPRGVKRWFRVKKRYFLKPQNTSFCVCFEGHTDTLDLNLLPKDIEYTKKRRYGVKEAPEEVISEEALIEAGKKAKPVDFESFRVKGADFLSAAAIEINNNTLLRFMKMTPNWQILLVGIIGLFAGMMVGAAIAGIMAFVFVLVVL